MKKTLILGMFLAFMLIVPSVSFGVEVVPGCTGDLKFSPLNGKLCSESIESLKQVIEQQNEEIIDLKARIIELQSDIFSPKDECKKAKDVLSSNPQKLVENKTQFDKELKAYSLKSGYKYQKDIDKIKQKYNSIFTTLGNEYKLSQTKVSLYCNS